ncbi:hypothetical protein ISS05_05175 [Candidatus Woesearchaeota archaeon]|nr:hypothetical protein [Candidatus Woesearchaeota archaeon]
MKHTLKITLFLTLAFFISQVIGLAITNEYIDHKATAFKGEPVHKDLPLGIERPEVEGTGGAAVIMIVLGIIMGTLLLLLIIRFRAVNLWKIWFFVAITFCLTTAFFPYTSKLISLMKISTLNLPAFIALALAVMIAAIKIFKPTMIIQNISELFVYGGLSAIFVSLFKNPQGGIFWAFILLLIISIYDIIAVWKTKHMIKLAKFQTKSNLFAGLSIPYKKIKKPKPNLKSKKTPVKIAILGGGDIAFPLIFAGVVMQKLMITHIEIIGFLKALIIPLCVTFALFFLLIKGKENKFYPAMPFLSIGCFVGYLIIWIL